MKVPERFEKELRKIDPMLRFKWDRSVERFMIVKLYGGHVNPLAPENGIGNMKAHSLAFVGEYGGSLIFKIVDNCLRVGYVTGPHGEFAPITSQVIEKVRAMDTWRQDRWGMERLERIEAKEEKARADKEIEIDERVDEFIAPLYRMGRRDVTIDLGAKP
jgi:hypothetical protein